MAGHDIHCARVAMATAPANYFDKEFTVNATDNPTENPFIRKTATVGSQPYALASGFAECHRELCQIVRR